MERGCGTRVLQQIQHKLHLDELSGPMRRLVVGIIGGTLVLVGAAMIVLPGPAFVVIPLGLAVLGTEFVWARRWIQKARRLIKHAKDSVGG